jgi:hypothetical protein
MWDEYVDTDSCVSMLVSWDEYVDKYVSQVRLSYSWLDDNLDRHISLLVRWDDHADRYVALLVRCQLHQKPIVC